MVTLRLPGEQQFLGGHRACIYLTKQSISKRQHVLHVHLCRQRGRGAGLKGARQGLQASVRVAGTRVWVRM